MGTTDPRVDAYIAKAEPFARPMLARIREQVHAHCPEAEETLKWSFPHFMYQGKILCSMAAFKAHCAFGFWLGSHMEIEGKSREAMGHFGRLTDISQLPKPAAMKGLIRQAMALTEAGKKPLKAPPKPAGTLEVPDCLVSALKQNPEARRTFEAFPPSCKKEYVEWITEAKTQATRDKRLAQALAWMAEGKRRNWKYEAC